MPCQAAPGEHVGMGLVDHEQRALSVGERTQIFEKSVTREDQSDIGERRFDDEGCNTPARQFTANGLKVVVGNDGGVPAMIVRQSQGGNRRFIVGIVGQRLVDVAMVAAIEHEDAVPARGKARQAQGLGHRRRGGQRELPVVESEPAGEVPGDRHGVLAGHEELGPRPHLSRHGLHDPGHGISGGRGKIGLVEVDIAVAVNVGERGAASRVDEDRFMMLESPHPCHGDP